MVEPDACIKPSDVKSGNWALMRDVCLAHWALINDIKSSIPPDIDLNFMIPKIGKLKQSGLWNQSPTFKHMYRSFEDGDVHAQKDERAHDDPNSVSTPHPKPICSRFLQNLDKTRASRRQKANIDEQGDLSKTAPACRPRVDSTESDGYPRQTTSEGGTESSDVLTDTNPKSSLRRLPPSTADKSQRISETLEMAPSRKPHFTTVGEYLLKLYEEDTLTDVVIHCGRYVFTAHAVILYQHCPFLCDALRNNNTYMNNQRHVTLAPEVSPTAFHTLLDYMYLGDMQITAENAAEMFTAVEELRMEAVQAHCREVIDSLPLDTILLIWEAAHEKKLSCVIDKTIKILCKNFILVANTLPFLNLNLEQVIALLKRNDLSVSSEYDVAVAAIAWLQHKKETRLCYAKTVMSCVRLSLLTSQQLFKINSQADFTLKNKSVRDLFLNANWFATSRQLALPSSMEIQLPPKRDLENYSADDTGRRQKCMPRVSVTRLMVLGGYDPVKVNKKSNMTMTYNRASHEWKDLMEMPECRAHHEAVILNEVIYVIGGTDPNGKLESGPKKTVFAFLIKQGKWQEVASLNMPRTRHRACVLDNKIYVIGGRNETQTVSSVERYDPCEDVWTEVAPMTCARLGVGVAAYRQQIIVTGGYGEVTAGQFSILSSVEVYDPFSNCWSLRAPLRTPRCHGSLVQAGNLLYLCGGLQYENDTDHKSTTVSMAAIDTYNYKTDRWSVMTSLRMPRHQVASAVLDGKLYIVGGMSTFTDSTSNVVECYDIPTESWDNAVKNLPRPVVGCGLVAAKIFF